MPKRKKRQNVADGSKGQKRQKLADDPKGKEEPKAKGDTRGKQRVKSGEDDKGKRLKIHHHADTGKDDDSVVLYQAPTLLRTEDGQVAPEVGIIERVVVKNFLCHQHQDIKFSPRVNFITGSNGSGKSAIMTAIIVGLGGKAATTTRGSNFKQFVKHGETSAEIAITVNNKGEDGFKPHVYGDSITVVRRLAASGSHGAFTLKNDSGAVVSRRRDELVFMLDQLNIQVDNPISILTQDTSKHFLQTKSPQDTYQFFMRATQLEQMEKDYVTANFHQKRANNILALKEKELRELEKEVADLRRKIKSHDAVSKLLEKVTALQDEMGWAIVADKEQKLEPARDDLKREEARLVPLTGKITDQENKLAQLLERKTDLVTQIAEMTSQMEILDPRHNELKAAKDDKKKITRHKQADVKNLEKELSRLQTDCQKTQDRIEEIRIQMAADSESQQRKARLEQLLEQLKYLDAQLQTGEQAKEQFHSAVSKNKQELAEIRREEQELEKEKLDIERDIEKIHCIQANRLRRFGRYMPEICQHVEAACSEGVFHETPRGPVGRHIRVKDKAWAIAVEVCLGDLLSAFCVTDHHDERELEKIFKLVCGTRRKPVIVTNKFTKEIFDVTKFKPKSPYPTVFDMLDLSDADPVIINNLIDQKNIESVLLIDTPTLVTGFNNTNPSKLITKAYTQEGDEAFFSPSFRFYSRPKDKTSCVLDSNYDDVSKRREQEKIQVVAKLEIKKHEARGKQDEMEENLRQEVSHQTSLSQIRDQATSVRFEMQDLKTMEEFATDVTSLEDDVAQFHEQIATITEDLNTKREELVQAQEKTDISEKEFAEVDKEVQELKDGVDPIKRQLAEIEEDIGVCKRILKKYVPKQQSLEGLIAAMKFELGKLEDDVRLSVEFAGQRFKRPAIQRTAESLSAERDLLLKKVAEEQRTRGNLEEQQEQYKDACEKLEILERKMHTHRHFLERLDVVMVKRQQNFFQYRQLLGSRTKIGFITYLNQRRYQGKLQFDHTNKTITIMVQPTREEEEGNRTDMRSLSGGERSYSTVCFVLALWDTIESPFRILDEFDVFMDMMNRRVSMDMMLQAAHTGLNIRRQFIFITPQDIITHLPPDVRILRMRPPIRDGQTTADQQQGGARSGGVPAIEMGTAVP